MTNQTNKSTINHPDDMSFSSVQVIAWSCALATEAVVIVVGNLLTIVLFALNKKLRSKKSLYLVLNMAFADLFLGGISLPTYVYSLALGQVKFDEQTPTLFTIIFLPHFRSGIIHYRCFDILWEILRHLLAAEAPADTFYASIQVRYFDGVDIKFPWFSFYRFSPAILKPGGSELFPVFILRVCTYSHQRPEFWCLEKDSATTCSSSPKQSLAKTTLDEDFVISISHRHGLLASTFGL